MAAIIFFPILISFFVVLFMLPLWIRKARQIGLVWEDMNKYEAPKVSGSGGVVTILGFMIGVFAYIAYQVFIVRETNITLFEALALSTVILLLTGIGFMDDLMGWRKGGLSRRSRIILVLIAAIPLMAINVGKSKVLLPFIGILDLGIFYPLLMIPLGIVGATMAFNIIAGCNGLEAGQGILLISALGIVAYITGTPWLAIIAGCMVAALLAFMTYNFYPARVFPGDSLTYALGGLIAIISILGDFEKIALFFFIPYILEALLKIRGKLIKHSFGKPLPDNTLDLPYEKFYSINHIAIAAMKKISIRPTERRVVLSIWIFQLIIIILGFIIFKEGLFE